jgi:chemotaxis protein methyltransferase CheR
MLPSYSETLGLPDSSFSLLRDLIHERLGLFYDAAKKDMLADKLASLVLNRGFDNFLDYYYFLKYDGDKTEEWNHVMDSLSVQETFFWRESDHLKVLTKEVVPRHFAAHPRETLRIWSAACATGEEPLSIAMALNEEGWFQRGAIDIRASDASPAALEKARSGLYRERSFRSIPPRLQEKYFQPEQKAWRISPDLQARVHWSQANVTDPAEVSDLASSHVIFCRNMFLYFSESSIRKTVEFFARKMPAPGYLFVSSSESLVRFTKDFRLQELLGAFVYVKQ